MRGSRREKTSIFKGSGAVSVFFMRDGMRRHPSLFCSFSLDSEMATDTGAFICQCSAVSSGATFRVNEKRKEDGELKLKK